MALSLQSSARLNWFTSIASMTSLIEVKLSFASASWSRLIIAEAGLTTQFMLKIKNMTSTTQNSRSKRVTSQVQMPRCWRSLHRQRRMAMRKNSHATTTSMIHSRRDWTSLMPVPSNSSLISSKMRTSWTRSGMKACLTTPPWIVKELKGSSSERIHRSLQRIDDSEASRVILWQIRSARYSTSNSKTYMHRRKSSVWMLNQRCENKRLKWQPHSKVWVSSTRRK